MKLLTLFAALAAIFGASLSPAADLDHWNAGNLNGLPYRLLLPDHYTSSSIYPLVVFLHGRGEAGDDNKLQLKNGVELFDTPDYRQRYPAIVLVPQSPQNDSWGGYYAGETETQKKLMTLVDEITRLYSVNANRRYLTGLSMGAVGGWDIVARHPGVFAAFMPVAGAAELWIAPRLLTLPIWAFHGAADDLISPQDDRDMYAYMQRHGGLMRYTEYPGVRHEAWTPAYRDTQVLDWLFEQSLLLKSF